MGADVPLSDEEWDELNARMDGLSTEEMIAAVMEIFDSVGRIPTPVDDHPFSRLIAEGCTPEQMMQTRVMPGGSWKRHLLEHLREKGGA